MLSLFAATLAFGANTADNSKQAVQTVKQSKDAKKKPAKKQREWAKFDRYESANARIKKAPAAVFMGDSITANWYSFRPEFFAENNYAGRGISGQTSSEMLVRFRNDVINLKPKYVAIMAGTNDVAENNGKIKLENVLSNIISMAELGRLHGIKVVLCSVLPASKIPWRNIPEPAQKIQNSTRSSRITPKRTALRTSITTRLSWTKTAGFPKNTRKTASTRKRKRILSWRR